MNNYLKEIINFQSMFGINLSFDFITGRDFNERNNKKKQIKNCNSQGIKNSKDFTYEGNDINDNMSNAKKDNNNITDIKKNNDFKIEGDYNTKEDNHCNMDYENIDYNLDDISSFDELCEKIKDFNLCSLKRYATNTVIFDGNKNAKIMLIGEAPGEQEDIEGKPFCGKSGQLLRKAISCIGLNESNVLITNTVYWRPPNNRKPYEDEIKLCLPFLKKMIEIVSPKYVILCGSTATETILKTDEKISNLVGKIIETEIEIPFFEKQADEKEKQIKKLKVKTFPIYHPAYILRNPIKMKKVLWEHLQYFDKILKEA